MSPQIEISLIAIVVSIMCTIPGIFLVLRKMAMISDSITHTILLGIVLGFFITNNLSSPLLIVGATLMGVFTVWLTEILHQTGLVAEDSAIGIVFPLLFSIAVILITRHAGSVHLDTDSILLGELAFAPFNRVTIFGFSVSRALVTASILLLINLGLLIVFFKELKIATFDPILAGLLGFTPVLIHYGIMTMVSISAVGAFEAVGSILVVAFMVGPAVTASLLTTDLKRLIWYAIVICIITSIVGYQVAIWFDISIAGSIATCIGLLFMLILIVSPTNGIIIKMIQKHKQKQMFAQDIFLIHVYHHMLRKENHELMANTIHEHLCWKIEKTKIIIHQLLKLEYIAVDHTVIQLTEGGMKHVQQLDYVQKLVV